MHDPFYAYLAERRCRARAAHLRDGWVGILRFTSDGLSTTYTTDDHAGVALWHPPDYDGAGFIDSLRLLPSVSRLAGGFRPLRRISRAVEALRSVDVTMPRCPTSTCPPWASSRSARVRGFGTALMQPVLARTDLDRTHAYLETATGRNVLLYERQGFSVVELLTLPGPMSTAG